MENKSRARLIHLLISKSMAEALLITAVAVGTPAVGIYGVRDIFNRWFPYGAQHHVLYHKFLNCDYNREECIKKSIDMVTVPEVKAACDEILKK